MLGASVVAQWCTLLCWTPGFLVIVQLEILATLLPPPLPATLNSQVEFCLLTSTGSAVMVGYHFISEPQWGEKNLLATPFLSLK